MPVRNLTNFLVHLFGDSDELEEIYLSAVHDHCLFCHEPISDSRSYLDFRVCPFCRFHYTLSARQRIEMIVDRRSFREQNQTGTFARCPPWGSQIGQIPHSAIMTWS